MATSHKIAWIRRRLNPFAIRPAESGAEHATNLDADVAIVGTGFAGICMALELKAAGFDFVLLESGDDVGGTWRDNDYPGCACDIPSHLYSFSFESARDWTRDFATQPEILAYLRDVVERNDLRKHVRFGTHVTRASYDDATATWIVEADGFRLRTRALVSATGGLSRPFVPDLAGLDAFAGTVFHSARWNHAYDLAGKSVAVIGTGASAVQFVPRIADQVANLYVFQRSAPWVLPKADGAVGPWRRKILRSLPIVRRLHRSALYWMHEVRALGFTAQPKLLRVVEKLARLYLRRQIRDPALRATLTPDYRLGCKRVLLSNDYYAALSRENVRVVTSPVVSVQAASIVTADGEERPIDAIVLGTGFRANEASLSLRVFGSEGRELADSWRNGAHAYLGISVAGFPNFFMLVGPNTGLGHNSMIYMIEAQVRYVVRALVALRRRKLRALEVLPGVEATFNRRLQRRMARTVWLSGCRSWYLDEHGKNTTLWPGFSFIYGLRTRRFRARRYRQVR